MSIPRFKLKKIMGKTNYDTDRVLKVRLKLLQSVCEEFQFDIYEYSKIRTDKFLTDNSEFWDCVRYCNKESNVCDTRWIPIGTIIKTDLITVTFWGQQKSEIDGQVRTVVDIQPNDNVK